MTVLDKNNLPNFHYIHKPEGIPDYFNFRGTEPTGDLPDKINFPLYKKEETERFKILVFGDTQPYSIRQVDFVTEDIVTELVDRKDIAFGMTMGDIVGDDLWLFTPLNQSIAKIGIPWHNILGNHDMNYMATSDELSTATFEESFGPANYAFVFGKVHFIILDDVIHERDKGTRTYVGGLRPDQFEFLENYLSIVPKDHLVVLNMHIPLDIARDGFRDEDQKRLFELLKDFPNTLSISAHTHIQDNRIFHQESSDWLRDEPHHHFNVGTTSGSWWGGLRGETDIPHTMMVDGTPNGYAFITFTGSEYSIDWKVAGSPDSHRMNIHLPRDIYAQSAGRVNLTVNFFNGCEGSTVKYRVKGLSEWIEMKKVSKPDPFYLKIAEKWENFDKLKLRERWYADSTLKGEPFPGWNMPKPQTCTHLWEANIGANWPPGRHVVEIEATDRYGQSFTAYRLMRINSVNYK